MATVHTTAIPHTLSEFLCVDFVNSCFTDHTGAGGIQDRLDLAEWQIWFAQRGGITVADPPAPGVRRRLIELRSLLRKLLESRQPPEPETLAALNRFLSGSSRTLRLIAYEQSVEAIQVWEPGDWRAVMAVTAASYVELLSTGGIGRVRVCANPDCSYMFVDESRNGSRRWCDATLCGNLLRVRRHRGA